MGSTVIERPFRVSTTGGAGPYVSLPYSRIDELLGILKKREIRHWVDEYVISLNGEPEVATVEFGRDADAEKIQVLLDLG